MSLDNEPLNAPEPAAPTKSLAKAFAGLGGAFAGLSKSLGNAMSALTAGKPEEFEGDPTEVCMEGNPMPEHRHSPEDTLKWTHPDVEVDYNLKTRTYFAYCPHCKSLKRYLAEMVDPTCTNPGRYEFSNKHAEWSATMFQAESQPKELGT